jgi:putative inorganic carbon (hco3(-)) transporter
VLGLLLTYGITAIGCLGALRNPVIGVYVYVGFAVLRPQYLWGWAGDLSIVNRLVGIALLAGWALNGFGSWRFGDARRIVAALLIYVLLFAISTVQALSVPVATGALTELSKIILPFLAGVTLLKTERQARTLLWIIVGAQAYVGFDLNMSYLQGRNEAYAIGYGGMDNNSLGISLVAVIGAAAGLLLSASGWRERLAAAPAVLVLLHTILLTFSRGAMLGLVAAGVTAFLVMPKRPRYLAAIVVVMLITLRFTGPELAARFESAFADSEDRDGSAQSRFDLWRDCFTVAVGQPFLGIGPKNWPLIAANYGWPPGKEAHSVWMQTLAEVGFPATLALIGFYALTCRKLWLMTRKPGGIHNPTTILGIGIIVSLLGYAVSAQFVSLQGLEVPFYVVAAGIVLLKQAGDVKASVVSPSPAYRPPNHLREFPRVQPVGARRLDEPPRGRSQPGPLLG